MKKLYLDQELPQFTGERLESICQELVEADVVILYLHCYPTMQLRFVKFEQIIIRNPDKQFVIFTWLDFNNPMHYKKVFQEHFTPTQISMWQENLNFIQLPATIEETLTKFIKA